MGKYEDVLNRFNLNIQEETISKKVSEIVEKNFKTNDNSEVKKFLYSCIDLTSLNANDSSESIWKLVEKINDFEGSRPDMENVAAVCVFPNFVTTIKDALTADVKIASVAGGFPFAQTFPEIKIAEVSLAVADGAEEIDIVINSGAFLEHDFETFSVEIQEIKDACRDATLKVILETGLLKTPVNIKSAAILAMYSGADFIKTSTGKIYEGATPEAVYVMCEAIKEYFVMHDKKIGIKVSGGIKTPQDAVKYYTIIKEMLGKEWLTPEYFRIGASSLAGNILEIV